jgi:nitrogen fixation/metabolism regulation signal transduction histidine kinase
LLQHLNVLHRGHIVVHVHVACAESVEIRQCHLIADVEDVVDKREVSVAQSTATIPDDNSVDSDAEAVRDTLYNLLKKGEEAFEDLKRIARELGETMSDDELKEMMFEANKVDRDGSVDRKDFLSILNK